MELSIIIVSWNTCQVLRDCLASIKSVCKNLEAEIFVVDNDSSDGTGEMIKKDFPEVHLINSGSNMGFAKANNLAIPHAKAQYILFLNPDTIVKQNTLQELCFFLNGNPKIGAIGCKILDANGHPAELPLQTETTPLKRFFIQLLFAQISSNIIRKIFPSHSPHESGYVRNLYGACLMVRKNVLDDVGYFDERFFMYAEDIDLCQRIHKKGWFLYYKSEVEIIHLEGQASHNAPKNFSILMMCESISKFMSKNYGFKGEVIYRFSVFISAFLRLAILSFIMCFGSISGKMNIQVHNQSWHKQKILLRWSLGIS